MWHFNDFTWSSKRNKKEYSQKMERFLFLFTQYQFIDVFEDRSSPERNNFQYVYSNGIIYPREYRYFCFSSMPQRKIVHRSSSISRLCYFHLIHSFMFPLYLLSFFSFLSFYLSFRSSLSRCNIFRGFLEHLFLLDLPSVFNWLSDPNCCLLFEMKKAR